MKDKLTAAADALMCAGLIVSLFLCLCTSFEISVQWTPVIIPTVIFCAVYTLLSRLVQKTFTLFVCVAVTMLVFILSLLFSVSEILSQLGYVITQLFSQYSLYYALPDSVTLGGKTTANATGLFVFFSALLSAAFAISLVRCRKIFVIVTLSIILLVPCFILINTLPEIAPLLSTVGILLTLWLTRGIRRFRPSQCGAVSLCVLAAVSVVLAVTLAFNPVETYERSDWQNSLLASAEELLSIDSGGLSLLDKAQNSLEKTQNLSEVSELEQTHTPQMTVTSTQKSGNMYLRGTAYASYSDNTWSVLSDEQEESFPDLGDFNTFTMTSGLTNELSTSVHMLGRSSMAYVPYLTEALPDDCSPLYDICVAGSGSSFKYSHSALGGETVLLQSNASYNLFVKNTYLQIPDDTKSALLEIANENGLYDGISANSDTDGVYYYDLTDNAAAIAGAVQSFVSSSAAYSLNTAAMPSGKDFPVWFLTESNTGYCVHFATAAVLMLRAMDVPARYVTGYYFTLTDGAATVTSDNAHAWCEYYSESEGWVPLECTPASFTPSVYTGTQSSGTDDNDYSQSDAEQTTEPTTEQPAAEQSAAEQPSTAADEQTSEQSTENSTDGNSGNGNSNDNSGGSSNGNSGNAGSESFKFEWNALTITLLVLLTVVLAITIIFLRRIIILARRKKRMSSGTANKRAVEAYREISRLARITHIQIPPEINSLYERARFSSHKITSNELGEILSFYNTSAADILSASPLPKRLYLTYIAVLR